MEWRKWWTWFLGGSTPIGSLVPGWNAWRGEQAAADTEHYLLGAAGPAKVELSAAQRARKREIA